jgi:prepilin-type processing-associated H-X9-DG protein
MLYEEPTAMRTITDGASHTAAFAELLLRRVSDTEWANGHNVFAQENNTPINGDSQLGNSIGGPHPGGALLAFCDGHIEFLEDSLEQPVLNALLTRAGGE